MKEPRKWLIEKRGDLTQEQVAELAEISRSAYANIENGKRDPSVTMAQAIAKVLKFDWIIFFEQKRFETKLNAINADNEHAATSA